MTLRRVCDRLSCVPLAQEVMIWRRGRKQSGDRGEMIVVTLSHVCLQYGANKTFQRKRVGENGIHASRFLERSYLGPIIAWE